MREDLLSYMEANLPSAFKIAVELPWEEGDNPLYLKNMKRVYLDEPYVESDSIVTTLDGLDISQDVTVVKGYLAVDAKNRNPYIDAALATIARPKTIISGSFRKEFDYTATIDGSVMTYELEYRFYNIA